MLSGRRIKSIDSWNHFLNYESLIMLEIVLAESLGYTAECIRHH